MTQASQATATCHDCPKPKDYVNNQGLKAHMKRMHQGAIDQVQKLATILSPPAPRHPTPGPPGPPPPGPPAPGPPAPAAPTPAPTTSAAPAPISGAAPKPFAASGSVTPAPVTQGGLDLITPNTSPIPRNLSFSLTPASTPALNPTTAATVSQEIEIQLQEEEDFMEAAKEEQDLFDELIELYEKEVDPEDEKDTREMLGQKLLRFQAIIDRKNRMIKESREKVKMLELSTETLKHDFKLSAEVEAKQRKELEDSAKGMDKTKKEIQNLKDRNKTILINDRLKGKENRTLLKNNKQYVEAITTLRESNHNLNKENNDLKEQLKIKESLVQGLQEEFGVEDTDEAEADKSEADESVVVNQETDNHTCNACNKVFKEMDDLERHINSKHNEKICTYCDKVCEKQQDLIKHHQECLALV